MKYPLSLAFPAALSVSVPVPLAPTLYVATTVVCAPAARDAPVLFRLTPLTGALSECEKL